MSIGFNKLICSFKSNLPNEIDFAMQVATLLANTENFIWSKHYQLVDAICSSLHVFTCVCKDVSTASSCDCYPRFWHKLLSGQAASNPHLQIATLPPDTEQSFLNFTNLKDHELKDQQKIYKRIKTAAELIKQFSMTCGLSLSNNPNAPTSLSTTIPAAATTTTTTSTAASSAAGAANYTASAPNNISTTNNLYEKNETIYTYSYHQVKKKKLKASPSLLKFVSLLLNCDDTPLNLIGLDILSNTAAKLSKITDTGNESTCTKLVQMFQEQCFDNIGCQDGDIYIIIRSIEVVSKLISSSSGRITSNVINLINERGLLLRIEQLLTSRNDVNLFLAALECCYRISRHQPHLIAAGRAQHIIKILVNLLDCEDRQFFTQSALKRIKLVDNDEPIDWTPEKPLPPPPALESKSLAQINNISKTNNTTNPKQQNTPNNVLNGVPNSFTTNSMPNNSLPNTNSQKSAVDQNINCNHNSTTTTIKENGVGPNGVTSQPQQNAPPPQPPAPATIQTPTPTPTKEYTCEWVNCNAKFTETKLVYTHVFETHIGSLTADALTSCQWSGPNGSGPGCLTKRPKYSLLTHLNDFHCNPTALERARVRSEPIKPPEHPGYGPNAALLAIKRHANTEKNGTKTQDNSPLSVSVRLTAALILRNLASESAEMKQALEYHEPLLSEICMTNGRDESKIIAECLSLFSSEQVGN